MEYVLLQWAVRGGVSEFSGTIPFPVQFPITTVVAKQQRRHEQELLFICSAKGASFTRADDALAGLLEA